MAEIRSMYKYSILVALVACLAIPSAEGRQVKSMDKNEVNFDMRETEKQGSRSMNSRQSIEGKKKIFPPPTMNFGDSETSLDDFRPTSPGISPGVGHSFAQDQQNAKSKLVADNSHKAEHFKTGVKDDFRPTAPGHSPGIGHAFRNKNAEPKA